MNNHPAITVLGAGAWGTALALAACRAGNAVTLWGRDSETIREISQERRNGKYLPGISLDPGSDKQFAATDDIRYAVSAAKILLLAIPAQQIASLVESLDRSDLAEKTLVCCAKGIDRTTGKLPSELLAGVLGQSVNTTKIAALSGPSFAADVANGLPTALTIASNSMAVSNRLAILLSSQRFRCYASTDLKGVELGGALKNVIAIAVGAVRGMGLGASAEAALVARGFAEMARLASALGADSATLTGLSGLGDLVLTCSHSQSRNFAYGMALGRSQSLENRPLAEGVFTAAIASDIASANGVETPIITAVSQVLARIITPREAVTQLLDRPLKREIEQDMNSGGNE